MATRGRKPILKDKRTTCVTVEGEDLDYLKDQGREVSEFLRESIAAFKKSKGSPIEQLRKDIEETKAKIMGYEIILHQQEMRLEELEELGEKEKQEHKERDEFEEKRRAYVIDCIKTMRTQNTCNSLWLGHLRDAWKFQNFDEAKEYVRNVWIDEGVPEKKVKNYLRLN
jgi:hypothetical protein